MKNKTEKIITENSEQVLKVKWDGEVFALVEKNRDNTKVIRINPREGLELLLFLASCGKEA